MRQWIIRGRDTLGLTQEDLAQRAGITRQAISSYETGTRGSKFGVPMLIAIAQALEMPMEDALQAEAEYLRDQEKTA